MPDIIVSVFISSSWRMKEFVADYRHRRGITDGCCSARVPRAERVDREDSADARLVYHEVLKNLS